VARREEEVIRSHPPRFARFVSEEPSAQAERVRLKHATTESSGILRASGVDTHPASSLRRQCSSGQVNGDPADVGFPEDFPAAVLWPIGSFPDPNVNEIAAIAKAPIGHHRRQ
jgi:hypothetical protein